MYWWEDISCCLAFQCSVKICHLPFEGSGTQPIAQTCLQKTSKLQWNQSCQLTNAFKVFSYALLVKDFHETSVQDPFRILHRNQPVAQPPCSQMEKSWLGIECWILSICKPLWNEFWIHPANLIEREHLNNSQAAMELISELSIPQLSV